MLPFLAHTYCACRQYVFNNLIMPLLMIGPESDISHVKARLWTFSCIYLLVCLLCLDPVLPAEFLSQKLADMWTLIPTTRGLWPNSAIRRAWYAVPRQRGALSQKTTGLRRLFWLMALLPHARRHLNLGCLSSQLLRDLSPPRATLLLSGSHRSRNYWEKTPER